jgi:hypothetical protein
MSFVASKKISLKMISVMRNDSPRTPTMPLAQDVNTWDFDEDTMNSVRRDKVLLLWLLICLG